MNQETNEPKKTGQNRGRPSKTEELDIERHLKVCFLEGQSAWTAAEKTGHSVNTVRKYYEKFYSEIKKSEAPEFVQACKERDMSTRLALEQQLEKLEKTQNELEKATPQDGTQYVQLCKLKIRIAQAISDLHLKILNIANAPTVDDLLASFRKEDKMV